MISSTSMTALDIVWVTRLSAQWEIYFFKSIPDAGIAIRYAGDEFIVLLTDADKACVLATINEINKNISGFNDSKAEPFELSVFYGICGIWQR